MVTICAAGPRGIATVARIVARGVMPSRLASYPQRGDPSRAFERVEALADEHGIPFERTTAPAFGDAEWVMFLGWQYRVARPTDRMIVFHDSLLPRYRGFAPTATALINGDPEIGVTAIHPVDELDAGPILGQRRWTVDYPIKAQVAIERQAAETGELAVELMRRIDEDSIAPVAQDHAAATYSLWRDEQDYFIDWTGAAETICRTVDALGHPFAGARTRIDGREVVVDDARVADDLAFERRDVGKVWAVGPDGPIVVCGQGCVRLTAMRLPDGEPFRLERLRCRLT